MGYSNMKVSLTYLRGLEVKQLDDEDLPEMTAIIYLTCTKLYHITITGYPLNQHPLIQLKK